MFSTAGNVFLFNKNPLSSCSVYALNKSNLKMNVLWLSLCPFYCFATLCWLYFLCHIEQKLWIFALKALRKATSGTGTGDGKRVALISSTSTGMNRDFHPDHQFWWHFLKSRTPRNAAIVHCSAFPCNVYSLSSMHKDSNYSHTPVLFTKTKKNLHVPLISTFLWIIFLHS